MEAGSTGGFFHFKKRKDSDLGQEKDAGSVKRVQLQRGAFPFMHKRKH